MERMMMARRVIASDGLVGEGVVADVHGGRAGGDGDGDEAVGAGGAGGDEVRVESDAPGGVVAQVEDEGFGVGAVRVRWVGAGPGWVLAGAGASGVAASQ